MSMSTRARKIRSAILWTLAVVAATLFVGYMMQSIDEGNLKVKVPVLHGQGVKPN
jgi:hypothetical protein